MTRIEVSNRIEENVLKLRDSHEILTGGNAGAIAEALSDGICYDPDWEDIAEFAAVLQDYREARAYFFLEDSGFYLDALEMAVDVDASREALRSELPGLAFNAKIAAKNVAEALAAAREAGRHGQQ